MAKLAMPEGSSLGASTALVDVKPVVAKGADGMMAIDSSGRDMLTAASAEPGVPMDGYGADAEAHSGGERNGDASVYSLDGMDHQSLPSLSADVKGEAMDFRAGGLGSQSGHASDEDPATVDERKQKRMLSNRESARRSRLRKQQHLDELRGQVAQLRAENSDMLNKYSIASRHFTQLTDENRALRSHAMDLSRRLQRLQHEAAVSGHPSSHELGMGHSHLDIMGIGMSHGGVMPHHSMALHHPRSHSHLPTHGPPTSFHHSVPSGRPMTPEVSM